MALVLFGDRVYLCGGLGERTHGMIIRVGTFTFIKREIKENKKATVIGGFF
jgi:hypothetical protein